MSVTAVLLASSALAAILAVSSASAEEPAGSSPRVDPAPAAPPPKGLHRFMVVRTFAPKALDGLDAAAKQSVNEKNTQAGVNWVYSFANADKTKTFCVYDGPNEAAVRKAAQANGIPVDYVVEVPVVLLPK